MKISIGKLLLLFLCGCGRSETTTVALCNKSNLIVIPVTIGVRTYDFVWDTGSTSSHISETVFEECALTGSRDSVSILSFMAKNRSNYETTTPLDWSIGGMDLQTAFVVDRTALPIEQKEAPKDCIHGIIGADIINRFYWLIDFEQNRITFSNKGIAIDESPRLVLNFSYSPHLAPYCKVVVNDSIEVNMLFDSGMLGVHGAHNGRSNTPLCYDFMVAVTNTAQSIWSYLSVAQNLQKIAYIKNTEIGRYFDSLKLNEYLCRSTFVALDIDEFHKTNNEWGSQLYITANFMRRFGKVYYDPFARKISFYTIKTNNMHTR